MSELIMPPSWVADALCAQVDADLFHPDKGEAADSRAARMICNGDPKRGTQPCPVRQACLDWALETGARHGVWGGTSARERLAMRSGEAA